MKDLIFDLILLTFNLIIIISYFRACIISYRRCSYGESNSERGE